MSEELKESVRRFYAEAWNAGQLDVIDELFAEDYVDHDAATHTDGMDGKASARAFIEIFRAAIPDLRCDIRDQVAEGDKVVSRWVATGTHEGILMGVAPTGRSFEIDGISIDRFDADGLFVEGWGTWDGVALLRQIGALPAPPPS
ncbi:MAG: ester cyclase [Thermoleophilaceae bacterium]|nr:ester cyclase [Thermoleophilaceae bacterium]